MLAEKTEQSAIANAICKCDLLEARLPVGATETEDEALSLCAKVPKHLPQAIEHACKSDCLFIGLRGGQERRVKGKADVDANAEAKE